MTFEALYNQLFEEEKNEKFPWVIMKCTNSENHPVVFFAALKSGFRVLLVDEKTPPNQMKSFIKVSNARCVITDVRNNKDYGVSVVFTDISFNADHATEETSEWAREFAYVTSGTTSEAKIFSYTAESFYKAHQGVTKLWQEIDKKHNKDHQKKCFRYCRSDIFLD